MTPCQSVNFTSLASSQARMIAVVQCRGCWIPFRPTTGYRIWIKLCQTSLDELVNLAVNLASQNWQRPAKNELNNHRASESQNTSCCGFFSSLDFSFQRQLTKEDYAETCQGGRYPQSHESFWETPQERDTNWWIKPANSKIKKLKKDRCKASNMTLCGRKK